MSEAQEKLKFRVGGMDCAACATKIEDAVGRLPGVGEVGVSLPNGTMTGTRAGDIAKGAIERQVKALGYRISHTSLIVRLGIASGHQRILPGYCILFGDQGDIALTGELVQVFKGAARPTSRPAEGFGTRGAP